MNLTAKWVVAALIGSSLTAPHNAMAGGAPAETTPVHNPASLQELNSFQGIWRSTTDPKSELIITGDVKHDRYDGAILGSNTIAIRETCERKGRVQTLKGAYLVEPDTDFCWHILSISEQEIILSYVRRGNILTYRRIQHP